MSKAGTVDAVRRMIATAAPPRLRVRPAEPPRSIVQGAPGGLARWLGAPTLGEVLDSRDGFAPGADFLRLALAILVMVFHTRLIVRGDTLSLPRTGWLLGFSILPMFFALGGFLLAASAHRIPLRPFLINRAFRMFPGLAVETLLSACILGPLLTTLALGDYLRDGAFYRYLLNSVGWVHFALPGMFTANPLPGIVNGSLWTVPQDLAGYAVIALLVGGGIFRRGWLFAAGAALLGVDSLLQMFSATSGYANPWVFFGTRLISGLFFGCALYEYRYKVPCHGAILVALLLVGAAVTAAGGAAWRFWVPLRALSVPAAAYLIVLLAMRPMPRLPLVSRGDYSYGIYLYAFPIQQSVAQLLPRGTSFVLHFAISIVLTAFCAAFSWHIIEKPLLRLRRRFSFVANREEAAASLVVP
jgi:peptidoglycan/LPS O-acetylase OafA/YrhL